MRDPKIRVSGLRYAVGGAEILKGVDAEIHDGGITAVVRTSGAGESTFLRALNRLIEPSAGEVYLGGKPTAGMDLLELRRRVGMVFQLPALFGRSVEEDILYGARLAGRDADAPRLLDMVGLHRSLAAREPETLSVGQQQRVSIAGALALEPEVLLMDEPHAPGQRPHRRHVRRPALLPLLLHGPPPAPDRRARRAALEPSPSRTSGRRRSRNRWRNGRLTRRVGRTTGAGQQA